MDEALIAAAIFVLGAGSGAALSYMNDRRMLRLYSSLVRQLSTALRQQLGLAPEPAGGLLAPPRRAAPSEQSVVPQVILR